MSDIRKMIRQILLEELAGHVEPDRQQSHVENISINSTNDLNAFALRILELGKTRDLKSDLQNGKVRFVLENKSGVESRPGRQQQSAESGSVFLKQGMITEKDISKLDQETTSLSVGKNVFFTPLAKDEIRRRGLKIKRISQ